MKKKWELGANIDISKLLTGLQKAKVQAEGLDKILENIGDYGNLEKLVLEYGTFHDIIEEMSEDVNGLKAQLGKSVKGGLVSNLDDVLEKLAGISQASQDVFLKIKNIDLRGSNAPEQLANIAQQLNTLMGSLDISDKIDLNLFNAKSVQEQFDEIANVVKQIGSQKLIAALQSADKDINGELQKQINGLQSKKKKYQDIIKSIDGDVKPKNLRKSANPEMALYDLQDNAFEAFNDLDDLEEGTKAYKDAVVEAIKHTEILLKTIKEIKDNGGTGTNWVNDPFNADANENIEKKYKKFKEDNAALIQQIKEEAQLKVDDFSNQITVLKHSGASVQSAALPDNSKQIKQNADKQIDVVAECKKQLVNAFKQYYNDVADAIGKGIAVEDGEASMAMDNTKMLVEKISNSLHANGNLSFEFASLFESIDYDDIGLNDIENEIEKIFKNLNVAVTELPDLGSNATNDLSSDLKRVEVQVDDTTEAFQNLVNYISRIGAGPANFFKGLENGAINVDDELQDILESLNLIDSQGNMKFDSIKHGFTQKGGFVSDEYTLIARPEHYKDKIESIMPQLAEAKKMGANVGSILGMYVDHTNGLMYEVQNTIKGANITDSNNNLLNPEFLNATDDQLKDLIKTLSILRQTGLFVDYGGDNILYDKDNGFGIIDLGNKAKSFTASQDNTIEENLDKFFGQIFKIDPSQRKNTEFVDHVYALAKDVVSEGAIDSQVKNKATGVDSSKAVAKSLDGEADTHLRNAKAIEQENQELKEQLDLKKKAQSMTFKDFALDGSLHDSFKKSGLSTLGDIESYWKKANYEKDIDFYRIDDKGKIEDIINRGIDKDLVKKWYVDADFSAKNQIENTILADDKLRNAAINHLYDIYTKYSGEIISFEEFLNKEFEVFRYKAQQFFMSEDDLMTFSFSEAKAEGFNHGDAKLVTAKTKPKDTIGSPSLGAYQSEMEILVPASKSSIDQVATQSFDDYYYSEDASVRKKIDAYLLDIEKKRVASLLDEHLFDRDGDLSYFKEDYNYLPEIQQKLVKYYEYLGSAMADLSWQGHNPEMSQLFIEDHPELPGILSEQPEQVKKHIAELTGEAQYRLLGQTTEEEAAAHLKNAEAIEKEKQAVQELNKIKKTGSYGRESFSGKNKSAFDEEIDLYLDEEVDLDDLDFDFLEKDFDKTAEYESKIHKEDLYSAALSEILNQKNDAAFGGNKFFAADDIKGELLSVQLTDDNFLTNGKYVDFLTGEALDPSDLIQQINSFENEYNETLTAVKEYLSAIYPNLKGINDISSDSDFDKVFAEVEQIKRNITDPNEWNKLNGITSDLGYMKQTRELAHFEPTGVNNDYASMATGEVFNPQALIDEIESYEDMYKKSLTEAKKYIKSMFSMPDDAGVDSGFDSSAELNKIVDNLEQETAAHRVNTQAIEQEAIAQQQLNQEKKMILNLDNEPDVAQLMASMENKMLEMTQDSSSQVLDESAEVQELKSLLQAVNQVESAVDLKTEAFEHEEDVVKQVVTSEISELDSLKEKLQEVTKAINAKNKALADEGTKKKESAKSETKKDAEKELQTEKEINKELDKKAEKKKKINAEDKKSGSTKKTEKTDAEKATDELKKDIKQFAKTAAKTYDPIVDKINPANLSGNALETFDKYINKYKEFQRFQNDIVNNAAPADEKARTRFNILREEVSKLAKEMGALEKQSEKALKNAIEIDSDALKAIDVNDLDTLKQKMQEFANATQDGKVQNLQFNESTKTLTYEINKGNGAIDRMTVSVDEYSNSLIKAKASGKGLTSAFGQFSKIMSQGMTNVFRYVSSFVEFYEVINQIRTGVNYIKEIDSALTELRKVTDETEASYDKFLDRMSETAGVVGSTVSELTTMAAEWGRLGYSLKEAGDLAESTAILLNVSEFQDATAASEALISTIQAFGYAANESMSVVDVLNEIGNSFAVSSDGLAVALQDSASALMTAGNNLEQSVALIAAANKVVRFVPRCHSNMVA